MRKTYHICLSSHREVMYRDEADLIMGFNCLAMAILETESRLLGEAFMTTHNHKCVQTDNHIVLEKKERYSYTRYFNARYHRLGSLGERHWFSMEVDGLYHQLSALSYVLRQGLHHGLTLTPFEYPHCSANAFFKKEMGRCLSPDEILPEQRHRYLTHYKHLPDNIRMAKNGLIFREDIVDTAYVEELYRTPRSFLYFMNSFSDDRTIEKQREENDLPPITLDDIEKGVKEFDIDSVLNYKSGRLDNSILTDLELCKIIDSIYLPRFLKKSDYPSIYSLSTSQREDMGNVIWRDASTALSAKYASLTPQARDNPFTGRTTSKAQVRRCLAI